MRTGLPRLVGILSLFSALYGAQVQAVTPTLAITPNTISNDYVGYITLTISNVAPGQSVFVERYNDVNGNGVIDAADIMVQRFTVTDGFQTSIGGVPNLSVPGDADGAADGKISVNLVYPALNQTLDHIAGQYIFRVIDPTNGFGPLTGILTVQQAAWGQGVTGTARLAGSGTPVSNAIVVAVAQKSGGYGTIADANGNFSLGVPVGNYGLVAFKPGILANMNVGFTANSNQWTSLDPQSLVATNTLSGRVSDIALGTGLAGLFMSAEATNNLITIGFTDTNGNFSLPTVASQWKVKVDPDSGLAAAGYVALGNNVQTNTFGGSVSNLSLQVPQANALIWGKVTDTQSNAVVDLTLDAQDASYTYSVRTVSQPGLGKYYLGVLGGTWSVGPDGDALAALGLIGQSVTVTVGNNAAVKTNLLVQRVTAHLRGRAVDNTGTPLSFANLAVNQVLGGGGMMSLNLYPQTASDGSFDIGLFGGNWDIQVECSSATSFNVVSTNLQVSLTDGVDQNNITMTSQRVTGQITVNIRDNLGNPVSAQPYASFSPGGNYNACNGNNASSVQIGLCNGTWNIGISGDMTSRGYDNPPIQTLTYAGGSPTVTFVLYPIGQTPAQLVQSAWVGGHFQFTVTGSPARMYRVQTTTTPSNPGSWVSLTTNTPYGGSFPFVDYRPPSQARFYRVGVVQ